MQNMNSSQNNLKKNLEELILSVFMTYYKTTISKTLFLHIDRKNS